MSLETEEMKLFQSIDENTLGKMKSNRHEHDRKVIISNNGSQRVVNVDITKNEEGEIIEVDTTEVATQRNKDGNYDTTSKEIHQIQGTTVQVIKHKVEDTSGHVILTETDTIERNTDESGNYHSH